MQLAKDGSDEVQASELEEGLALGEGGEDQVLDLLEAERRELSKRSQLDAPLTILVEKVIPICSKDPRAQAYLVRQLSVFLRPSISSSDTFIQRGV